MEDAVIPVITEATTNSAVDIQQINTSLETIINKLSDMTDLLNKANDLIAKLLNKFMEFMDFMAIVSSITLLLFVALFVMLAIKRR